MKFNRRVPVAVAVAAAIGVTAPFMVAAADPSGTVGSAAEVEAALEAELAEATIEFDMQMAVYESCAERVGLTEGGVLSAAEETRQTRIDDFNCRSEAWSDWYGDKPTPLAPPADWDPDASQLADQSAITDSLSAAMTAEGVEHTVVTEENGVRWVDYDDFDPVAASTVGEIISRGDHYVESGADSGASSSTAND